MQTPEFQRWQMQNFHMCDFTYHVDALKSVSALALYSQYIA